MVDIRLSVYIKDSSDDRRRHHKRASELTEAIASAREAFGFLAVVPKIRFIGALREENVIYGEMKSG